MGEKCCLTHRGAIFPDRLHVDSNVEIIFVTGNDYRRRALHDVYGGQQQGGISIPKNKPFIFLFTGASGDSFGYKDDWREGIFYYTGEGQRGDMRLVAGNKAIAQHAEVGKDLYLSRNLSVRMFSLSANSFAPGITRAEGRTSTEMNAKQSFLNWFRLRNLPRKDHLKMTTVWRRPKIWTWSP